jgi:hypothetical protein
VASAIGLPVAALVGWLLTRLRSGRPVRYAVAEVAMVAGTLPWLWMILTPSPGTARRLSLVPLHDLLRLAPADLVVQIGGNLLVFAAAGFFLPVRFAVRIPAVLAAAAAGSVTVEALQYLLDLGRVSSVDDVLVNAAGAGLAAVCSTRWWRVRSGPAAHGVRPDGPECSAVAQAPVDPARLPAAATTSGWLAGEPRARIDAPGSGR